MAAADNHNSPIWDEALDWLMRFNATPDDAALKAGHAAWLARGEAQRAAWSRAQKTWTLMGAIPPAHAGEWQTPVKAHPARHRRWLTRGAPAAIAAALLAFAVPGIVTWLRADHMTATGEIRSLTLADGSVVTLDTDSAIEVDFSAHRRAVTLLEGQAFFEVTADPARPFSVTADTVAVTVVGTGFDVRRDPDSIAVGVVHGTVQVDYTGDGMPQPRGRLTAGQQLYIDRTAGTAYHPDGTAAPIAAWREHDLVVDNATLASVIDELRRYYPGVIVVTDGALASKRVTGVYDVSDPIAALRVALRPHGGTVETVTPLIAIVSAP